MDRDADNYYSFHTVQQAIADYREERIKGHKLVYPKVTSGGSAAASKKLAMMTGGGGATSGKSMKKTAKRKGKVSTSVACGTMFQFNKGQTNPDVIKQVRMSFFLRKYYIILVYYEQ